MMINFIYFREAWLLYRGPLLASNSIEEWAIPENLHYKELYRDCTNQIADILKEKERWEDLYTLYTTALGIETYEEWQLGQLDALIALGEYEKAYKHMKKRSGSIQKFRICLFFRRDVKAFPQDQPVLKRWL